MAGLVKILFDEALSASKRSHRFARCGIEQLRNFVASAGNLEPASAAAERGLDCDGKSVSVDESEDFIRVCHGVECSRRERRPNLFGDVAGTHLVAEAFDCLGARADPDQPRIDDSARKVSVFREEAVTRVDRVSACSFSGRQDFRDNEVCFGTRRAVEGNRFVRELDVLRVDVLVRIHGNRLDLSIAGCANNANRNFSAVRDEYFRDAPRHVLHPISR